MAYTLPASRLPTNTVPFEPRVMDRASLTPEAKILISKPGGNLIEFKGKSRAANSAPAISRSKAADHQRVFMNTTAANRLPDGTEWFLQPDIQWTLSATIQQPGTNSHPSRRCLTRNSMRNWNMPGRPSISTVE